jgi:uncharacterized membrane protein
VTTDTELESWRREWRDQTEPLPELKRKIRRQNLRMIAGVIAICICLVISAVEAFRHRSAFVTGMAMGIGFASLFLGGYTWWVRRGAWKPTAQTTLAYAELAYKRAIAKSRTIRLSFYLLLTVTVLLTALVALNWKTLSLRNGVIIAAIVAELFFLKYVGRRKQKEIIQTKKLVDDLKN